MKNDRLLEEIKSKFDIVDFISGYVQLRQSGQNWKGICPFHPEKTPSFMVSPSRQTFHCFGCGAGGDVIAFVLKYENLSFGEALKFLAEKAGITLTGAATDKKTLQKIENIRDALSGASDFYMRKLRDSGPATAYLEKRGISAESINLFKIGYAPQGWDNLLQHLRHRGCADSIIKEAGLAVSGEKGIYDMFRHRIMFPITSGSGNVLAFGGRALDDSLPKYINSPETAVYKKSDTLFGLSAAKEEIRRLGTVLIVEGYMDVVLCRQFGFNNVVAPLGTALTPGHIQKLRPLAGRAVLVFDGDAAGRSAAKRTLPLICRNNYKASVLVLPDNEDPDSYLRKHGSPAFRAMIEGAKTIVDFILGISTGEKNSIAREVLALAAEAADPLVADEMLRELADRTRINDNILRQEFAKIKGKTAGNNQPAPSAPKAAKHHEEYLLLSAMIAVPDKAADILSRIGLDEIHDKTIASIFRKISSADRGADILSILEDGPPEERELVTRLSVEPGFDLEHIDRNIDDCIRKIDKRDMEEERRQAEMSGDLKLMNDLLMKKKRFIEGAR